MPAERELRARVHELNPTIKKSLTVHFMINTHKFTPGPWVALYDTGTSDKMGQNHRECSFGERHIVATGSREGSPCIADCGYGRANRSDMETLANVRLIASAPAMLEALELIHANAGESAEWIRSRIEPALKAALNGKT